MSNYYYHNNGDYGPVENMDEDTEWTMIVPTFHYTREMWNAIHKCPDGLRLGLARHFGVSIHDFGYEKELDTCNDCHLTVEELNIEQLNYYANHLEEDTDAYL